MTVYHSTSYSVLVVSRKIPVANLCDISSEWSAILQEDITSVNNNCFSKAVGPPTPHPLIRHYNQRSYPPLYQVDHSVLEGDVRHVPSVFFLYKLSNVSLYLVARKLDTMHTAAHV